MITRPEEAVPIEVLDGFTDQMIPMFTAAECAEIAKAYASATVGQRASWDAEFRKWGYQP